MPTPLTFSIQPLQDAIAARLREHAWLANIPVLTERHGDIENEIQRALGELEGIDGVSGVCIVILTPAGGSKLPNAPGPILDDFNIVLSVIENVMVNQSEQGTNIRASQVVEFLLRYLHLWTCPGANAPLVAKSPAFSITNAEPLTYQVYFQTKIALQPIRQ
jgi:hypothetical protein